MTQTCTLSGEHDLPGDLFSYLAWFNDQWTSVALVPRVKRGGNAEWEGNTYTSKWECLGKSFFVYPSLSRFSFLFLERRRTFLMLIIRRGGEGIEIHVWVCVMARYLIYFAKWWWNIMINGQNLFWFSLFFVFVMWKFDLHVTVT